MNVAYVAAIKISMADLLDGRLEKYGVTIYEAEKAREDWRCLTDGENYVWVGAYEGDVGFFVYDWNVCFNIFGAIATEFDTQLYCEYEPQFWGFDSEAEWDACLMALSKRYEDKFYSEIIQGLTGGECVLKAGTIGFAQFKIAEKLVLQDQSLLQPAERERLMTLMREEYDQPNISRSTNLDLPLSSLTNSSTLSSFK